MKDLKNAEHGGISAGVAATTGASVLIVDHQDSGPALFTVQIIGLLGGPTVVRAALVWLFAIVRRLRGVRLRQWRAYPARSPQSREGPVSARPNRAIDGFTGVGSWLAAVCLGPRVMRLVRRPVRAGCGQWRPRAARR
jgi:hypothetical protein